MARWDDEIFNMQEPPKDIQCTTCKFRLKPVKLGDKYIDRSRYGKCDKYDIKPHGILWDNGNCYEYEEG